MKSTEKSGGSIRESIIHLNGQKRSKSFLTPSGSSSRKSEPLRSKIDIMLQKDYSDWRSDRNRFNAINSMTAKSSETIQQYVRGIYTDYQIPDPLQQKLVQHNIVSYLPQEQNGSSLPFNQQASRETGKFDPKVKPHFEQSRSAYLTPVKQYKRNLEVIGYSKDTKQSVSKQIQKSQYANLSSNDQLGSSTHKVKFVQRTAPSLHSLDNSRNAGLTLSEFDRNALGGDYNNQMLFHSRLSLAARLAGEDHANSKIPSYQMLNEYNQPSISEFKQSRQFLSGQKTQHQISHENKVYPLRSQKFLREKITSGQLKSISDRVYAEKLLNKIQTFDQKSSQLQNSKIKQSFRYCVGCQESVLQANIKFHENQCKEFNKILNFVSIDEILIQLDKKIDGLTKKINQRGLRVDQKDKEQILQGSRVLISEVESSKKNIPQISWNNPLDSNTFKGEYARVIHIGTNWGLLTEEVNKLKWFLMVKNNFMKLQSKIK